MGFEGQKSKVKVTARQHALYRRMKTFRWCGVDAHLRFILKVINLVLLVIYTAYNAKR